MEITLNTVEYIKTEGVAKKVFLPDEKSFYFETGIRRSIAVIPKWTTWQVEQMNKPEEIYGYDIICVYRSFECKVDKFNLQVSQLNEIFNSKPGGSNEYKNILEFLISVEPHEKRTQEQFIDDFGQAVGECEVLLGLKD